MSDKISKEELREPDAFLKTMKSSVSFIEKYGKVLGTIATIAVVAALGYQAYTYLQAGKEKKAQEAFYVVEAKYNKAKEGFDRAKMNALLPDLAKKTEGEAAPIAATGDLEKDFGTLPNDLQNVINAHKGTKASAQAGILLAQIYLDYKQPEKAIEAIKGPAGALSQNQMMGGLSHMMLGNALAQKGDCNEAISMWQKVLQAQSVSYLHPDASLRSGICYENLQQNDKAIEQYRRTSQDFADSIAGQTAKTLLRALELKQRSTQS